MPYPYRSERNGPDDVDHEGDTTDARLERAAAVGGFLRSAEAEALDPDPFGSDARTVHDILLSGSAAEPDGERSFRILDVLRALVRHGHARCGTGDEASKATFSVLESLGAYTHAHRWDRTDFPIRSTADRELGALVRSLGTGQIVLALDTRPLPDEDLDLSSVPADLHELIPRLVGMTDAGLHGFGGEELGTACRRALVSLSERSPEVLRRRAKETITAAAVVWAVGTLNDLIGRGDGQWQHRELCLAFGVGAAAHRGQSILDGLRRAPRYADPTAPIHHLLTSRRRLSLIERRDRLIAQLQDHGIDVTADELDRLASASLDHDRWGGPWQHFGHPHRRFYRDS